MSDARTGDHRPSSLRAVIFDMDGVIADTEPLHARAYREAFRTFGIQISGDRYRKAVTQDGKTTAAWFVELGGKPELLEELYARKDRIYFSLLRERGTLRPGLVDLLSSLRDCAVPCALATSARRINAEFLLDLFGLRPFFHTVLALEDVSRAKPDPEVFLLALKRLSAEPRHTVAVEDAPKGVRAAAAAGIPVVAVPTSWTCTCRFDGACLIVDSMEQLSVTRLDNIVRRRKEKGYPRIIS